jgi:mannitol/fructose-specific phosphotransferase system IIA component (Ntr-type)
MKVQDLLARANVLLDVQVATKQELILTLGGFLASACGLPAADTVVQRMMERESQVSTGIGHGIAIPHCRIEGLERSCMVAARIAEAVDFDSLDDNPVSLVFMMISPTNTSAEHGSILKRLSQVVAEESVRRRLLAADTAGEFVECIAEAEDGLL